MAFGIRTTGDALLLKHIQMIIARAAQSDSMAWWPDDSLTEAGRFMLRRLYPFAPGEQAKRLALHAARSRHDSAFSDENVLHLFRIDLTCTPRCKPNIGLVVGK